MDEIPATVNESAPIQPEAIAPKAEAKPQRKRDDDIPDEKIAEMFDLSKPLDHVARPDKAEHNKEVDEFNAEIAELEKKRDAITEKINTATDEMKKDTGLGDAKKSLDALFQQRNALQRERDALIAQQKTLRTQTDKLAAEKKNASQSVKYFSLDEINKAIKELQTKQSTTSMSLSDEKKLLKEIDALTASKRLVAQIDSKNEAMKGAKKSREELNIAIDAKRKEVDAVYKLIDAQRKVVDEIQERHQSTRSVIPGLVAERNGIRGQINSIKAVIREKRDEYRKANNAWFLYTRALRIQKKMKYEEEKKAREEAWAAKQKAIEEEEAKKIPYEEEMGLCDYLVKYLDDTYVKTDAEKAAEKAAAVKKEEVVAVKEDPFANFKPISKKDDEIYLKIGAGGKKLRKKGNKKKVAEKEVFRLNVDTFEQFGLLNLNPPTSIEAVPASIEELKAKKKWYSEQPRGSVKTAYEIRKAAEEDSKKYKNPSKESNGGSKKQKSFNLKEDDFVPLGTATTTVLNSSWGISKASPTPAEDVEAEEQ